MIYIYIYIYIGRAALHQYIYNILLYHILYLNINSNTGAPLLIQVHSLITYILIQLLTYILIIQVHINNIYINTGALYMLIQVHYILIQAHISNMYINTGALAGGHGLS